MLELGNRVTTPTGEEGTLATIQGTGGTFAYYGAGSTNMNIAVWAVILDNGEVRNYTQESLTVAE